MRFVLFVLMMTTLLMSGCAEPMNSKTNTSDLPNDPVSNSNLVQPVYIDEASYSGEELEIVQWLNAYVRAVHENDFERFNQLVTNPINSATTTEFKKYIVEITDLDFSVKPDPAPPADVKPVLVEMRVIYAGLDKISTQKQMFSFIKESGEWKLYAISDWWHF